MSFRGGAEVFSGYILKEGQLIFGAEEFEQSGLNAEDTNEAYGEFALLRLDGSRIELSADFFGLSQWYYYAHGNVFAASNHYHLLLELLSRCGEKLSMNIKRSRVNIVTSGFMYGSNFDTDMDVENCRLNLPYEKIIFEKGELKKENTELYHILIDKEEWDEDRYDDYVREAAEEIQDNTLAFFSHQNFERIVIDINAGFDSRIVFAAANNMPRRLRRKIWTHIRRTSSRENNEKAAAVANLYNYGRVSHEDGDTSEVLVKQGEVNLSQISRTLGSFSNNPDLYKTKHTDEHTLQLTGNLGVSLLGYKRCRGELQYSLGDQRLLARLGNCYLWNEVAELKDVFKAQKELINQSLDGYGCNDLFKKFHILYMNFRSRFICGSSHNVEYNNLNVSPLQSKAALRAKWMYFNRFANNEVPDEKLSIDLLTLLNPLLAALPFASSNDDVIPKAENLLWGIHVNAVPDYNMKPDKPLTPPVEKSRLYRTKVAEYMEDLSLAEQMLLQVYDYSEEFRPVCLGLYRVLQEFREKPEDLRGGHGREQIRKIYDVYYQMSFCKSQDERKEEESRQQFATIFERKDNKITIESVYADGQYLKADIVDNGIKKCLWFCYSDNYQPVALNADAFLIYLTRYAMINNRDIISKVPVHDGLLNSIRRLLIPAMHMSDPRHARVNISAPYVDDDNDSKASGVATGLSCGVDSFYALLNHYKTGDKHFDVTHLFFFDMFHPDINHEWETFNYCKNVAEEMGFSIIKMSTNVLKVLGLNWFPMHLYSLFAGINSMQNIIGKYYLASGLRVTDVDMTNALWTDPAHFELLLIKAFHHQNMEIYIEGPITRINKTDFIADFPIVQNRLSVCWPRPYDSCCICPKCVRTLVDLDALGKLDKFGAIFDLVHYKKNRDWYLSFARTENDYGNVLYFDSVRLLRERGEALSETFEDKMAQIIVPQSEKLVSYFSNNKIRSVLFFGRQYDKFVDEMADILQRQGVKVYCYIKDKNKALSTVAKNKVIFVDIEQLQSDVTIDIGAMILVSLTLNLKCYSGLFNRMGRPLTSSIHLSEIIDIPFFKGKEVEVEMNKVI